MQIKTKLTLTTAMSIEKDLEKEDKDLSELLGAHSTELAKLEPKNEPENNDSGSTKLAK